MYSFFETLKNIWKIEELRNRIFITLFFLAIYRLGAQVVLPGIDSVQLAELSSRTQGGGLLGILNAFTGGAFANASVFALGIMPYISASIVVQLMGIAVPYLQKLQKEGESGRKTINQITRWLTILICVVQAPAYLYSLGALGVPESAFILGKTPVFVFSSVVILVTGCVFAMWLGEKITDKGIGNGISLLITVGIIASLPQALFQEFKSRVTQSNGGAITILIEVDIWIVVIALCAYVGQLFGDSSFGQWLQTSFSDMFGLWYNILFGFLIIVFTYFYTAITVPTNKMSDDLKRSGGFVPGIRPGGETSEFLDKIMSLITFPGSLFLAAVSVLPAIIVQIMGMQQGWALFYGGTSLLIMVGVAIDTIQQINAYLLNRHYDGLMKTGKKRKLG